MFRKIIVILLCFLFIIAYIPVVDATEKNISVIYKHCYIVSSGIITFRLALGLFKIGDQAFIIYLNLGYDENGNTSIYDEYENLIWQKQGEHYIIILFYRGKYSYIKSDDGSIFISLDGLALIASV